MTADDLEVAIGVLADAVPVEWDDDFVPADRQSFDWEGIAVTLRANPGRWARIPGAPAAYVSAIRAQKGPIALRAGQWQAATRRGQLYVRFLRDNPEIES